MRSSGHYVQTFIRSSRAQVRLLSPWLPLPQSYFCYLYPSNQNIATLNKVVQELRDKLAESQRAANREIDRLNETINSLVTHDESSSASISTDTYVSLTSMSTRRQDHTSRTDHPTTPRPTCRHSTQDRRYQPCTRANASMRILVCPRSYTLCCGMSSRHHEYRIRGCESQQVYHRLGCR